MSTRPVPTHLDSWPGVSDLLIDQKFFLHVLWSSPSSLVSVCGVGRAGIIERLCGASRLDESVVIEALRELDRRGLVVLDEATREVAIRKWVRFHKFPGKWAALAEAAYAEIDSSLIKSILIQQENLKAVFPDKPKPPQEPPPPQENGPEADSPDKSKDPAPNSNSNSNSNEPPSKRGAQVTPDSLNGMSDETQKKPPIPASRAGALPPVAPVGAARTCRHVLTDVGIWYEPGNERDMRSFKEISRYSSGEVARAIEVAAASDDQRRAFASATLRALIRGGSGGEVPAWAGNVWLNGGEDIQDDATTPAMEQEVFEDEVS